MCEGDYDEGYAAGKEAAMDEAERKMNEKLPRMAKLLGFSLGRADIAEFREADGSPLRITDISDYIRDGKRVVEVYLVPA